MSNIQPVKQELYSQIASLITNAHQNIKRVVNRSIVDTYWNIGKLIVEEEQKGEQRAEYGKGILKELGNRLTVEFGKGFNERNLRYMRQFFIVFSKWNAVRSELSWSHYRLLLKVENEQARLWYMTEAVKENWSTRALERQINSFYYDRLLVSKNKTPVKKEAVEKTNELKPHDVLKDPYVLEFLQLKNRSEYTEGDLETALIDELQNFLLELGSGFSFVARQKHFTRSNAPRWNA